MNEASVVPLQCRVDVDTTERTKERAAVEAPASEGVHVKEAGGQSIGQMLIRGAC